MRIVMDTENNLMAERMPSLVSTRSDARRATGLAGGAGRSSEGTMAWDGTLDSARPEPQISLMTALQEMEAERLQNRERLRLEMRRELRAVLGQLVPALKVIVFGSLAKCGRFTENSDIDLALETEPAGLSLYQLAGLLAERLGRRVDLVWLPECRFRDKILREGEAWTPLD